MTLIMPELFDSIIPFHGHYPKRKGRGAAQNVCRKLTRAQHTLLVIYAERSNHRQHSQ